MADLTTVKNWFKTSLKPTKLQFWTTWDSFWHKSENIPANQTKRFNIKSNVGHTHSVKDIIGLQPQSQNPRSVLSKGWENDYMFLNENQLGMFNSNNR
ncbi:MAG: hypothetical protein PSV16_14665 [Flavobacterium sp.]|nr:hypothetical protein [Flavobacterium sp.]